MKKALIICFVCTLVLSLASCAGGTGYSINSEESFFSDFSIEGDSVIFRCHLVVENGTDETVSVLLEGDFSADARAGLILEPELRAADVTTGRSVFVLAPGKNVFNAEFVGTHGSIDEKQDRRLPVITFQEVSAAG